MFAAYVLVLSYILWRDVSGQDGKTAYLVVTAMHQKHLQCYISSPQRTNRIPKDIHVEPERFAAELISRLEGVVREREAQEKLEERLKRVRLVCSLHFLNQLSLSKA